MYFAWANQGVQLRVQQFYIKVSGGMYISFMAGYVISYGLQLIKLKEHHSNVKLNYLLNILYKNIALGECFVANIVLDFHLIYLWVLLIVKFIAFNCG